MTFQELQDEIIRIRFKESQRSSIKWWLNQRMAKLWTFADWPWAIAENDNLAVVAGNNTPLLPQLLRTPHQLLDELGDELELLDGEEFDRLFVYGQIQGTRTRPGYYKFNNGVLTLGHTPESDANFRISYRRRLYHHSSVLSEVVGPMVDDESRPAWDDHWHEVLVVGAVSLGLKLENDPTWEPLEEEYRGLVQDMMEDYLPAVLVHGTLQYGVDCL